MDWSPDGCSSDLALEAELARSRAAAARGASGEANPQQVAEGLVAVIERTEHGEAVIFTVDIDPARRLPIEDSDLAEMLGALVENAARHARRQAPIPGRRDGAAVVLAVEDDGPGMTQDTVPRATQRGVAIDSSGNGHRIAPHILRHLRQPPPT